MRTTGAFGGRSNPGSSEIEEATMIEISSVGSDDESDNEADDEPDEGNARVYGNRQQFRLSPFIMHTDGLEQRQVSRVCLLYLRRRDLTLTIQTTQTISQPPINSVNEDFLSIENDSPTSVCRPTSLLLRL
jgi:hypothetical protein